MVWSALTILSIPVAFFGAILTSQATHGVGLICLACYIGILARIGQAAAHEKAKRPKP